MIGRVSNALVVNPAKIKADTVKDFIAYAKANPGKVTTATQGNGTTSHLTSELFQLMANVKLQNVPYRGSAPALNDLVSGSVDCDVRQSRRIDAVREGGQAEAHCGRRAGAHQIAAERADHRGNLAGLCFRDLVRARRSAQNALRRSSTRSMPA